MAVQALQTLLAMHGLENTECDLEVLLVHSGRVRLLAELKRRGVTRLSDRQAIANALGKLLRGWETSKAAQDTIQEEASQSLSASASLLPLEPQVAVEVPKGRVEAECTPSNSPPVVYIHCVFKPYVEVAVRVAAAHHQECTTPMHLHCIVSVLLVRS